MSLGKFLKELDPFITYVCMVVIMLSFVMIWHLLEKQQDNEMILLLIEEGATPLEAACIVTPRSDACN